MQVPKLICLFSISTHRMILQKCPFHLFCSISHLYAMHTALMFYIMAFRLLQLQLESTVSFSFST